MAANGYYQNYQAGDGQYQSQHHAPPYGQPQEYNNHYPPPSPQPYYAQQQNYGHQAPPYNPPASNYGPPPTSPYMPQSYPNPPPTHDYQSPPQNSYNTPPPGYASPAPSSSLPPPQGDDASRGWKTNATLAGGAALLGGALLHHHTRPSSPSPSQHSSSTHHSFNGHPLAGLADRSTSNISLTLVDEGTLINGDQWDRYVLRGDPSAGAVYRVKYTDEGASGTVYRGPLFGGSPSSLTNPGSAPPVGKWSTEDGKLKFKFPETKKRKAKEAREWGDWRPDENEWGSDIGMLDERWLKWRFEDESRYKGEIRFTLRCVDTEDADKRVASQVVMETCYEGHVSVPLWAVKSEEELDEMMVVTFATLDWWRDTVMHELGN